MVVIAFGTKIAQVAGVRVIHPLVATEYVKQEGKLVSQLFRTCIRSTGLRVANLVVSNVVLAAKTGQIWQMESTVQIGHNVLAAGVRVT